MIIIGDEYIPYEKIEAILKIEDIQNTSSNSTVVFSFDKNIMKYCMENNLNYAVKVSSIKEAIFASSLEAKYIITKKEQSKTIQQIAENYMFDSKVLAIVSNESEFEDIATQGIDGVIYSSLL